MTSNIDQEAADLGIKNELHINEYKRYRKTLGKDEAFSLLKRKHKKGSKVKTPDGDAFILFRTCSTPPLYMVMFTNGSNRLYLEDELNA